MDQLQAQLNGAAIVAPTPRAVRTVAIRTPTISMQSPTVQRPATRPAARPEPAVRRLFPPWAKLGATVLVIALTLTAGYILDQRAGDDSTYEANQRVAESLGTPSGFARTSVARTSGDLARATYGRDAPPGAKCGDRSQEVHRWLAAMPGVEAAAEIPGCLIDVTPRSRRTPIRCPSAPASAWRTAGSSLKSRWVAERPRCTDR